jgi:hypothetical protein
MVHLPPFCVPSCCTPLHTAHCRYKPESSLAFIAAFVKGEQYKPYVKAERRTQRHADRLSLFPDVHSGL